MRLHPVLGYWKLHDGTDFGAACGTPIKAAASGVVSDRYYNAGYGNRLMAYPVDKPRNWDAWDIEGDYAMRGEEIADLQSLEVVEEGPAAEVFTAPRHPYTAALVQARPYPDLATLHAVARQTSLAWEIGRAHV